MKMTPEHKNKLSIIAKKRLSNPRNHPNWNESHHYQKVCFKCKKEFEIRLSEADINKNRGKFCSIKCHNINNSQNISKKQRRNMSLAAKGKPKPWAKKNILIARIAQQNTYSTSIEKKVYEELKRRGLLFEKQKLINGRFLVDAYIPNLNLIIEADGNYWHSREDIIKRDKAKNAYLTKCGFNLLRLTETEINQNVKIAIERIYQ